MDDLIGTTIGSYTITELLGEGGMAVVYKAHQASLDRDVAIKILTGPLARDEEFVARFRREAMAAGALGHPNLLTIHDAGTTDDGLHYIVMEYAPGGTLKELLERGPLAVDIALTLAAQIADALHVAHEQGIVHRDLKPSNILFSRDGRPLLMDFGVALTSASTRLTRTGMTVGTPEYMSPELAQGLPVDRRSDIYSLGILLYEMLTGDVPFLGDTPLATLFQHVHNQVSDAALHASGVPTWVLDVIMCALAKRPEDRYATARQMAAALRKASSSPTADIRRARTISSSTAPAPASVPAPRRRGRAWVWALVSVAAIALVAGATYLIYFQPPPWLANTMARQTPIANPVVEETSAPRAHVQSTVAYMVRSTATAAAQQTAEASIEELNTRAAPSGTVSVSAGETETAERTRVAVAQMAMETSTAVAAASTRAAQAEQSTALAQTAEAQRIQDGRATEEARATASAAAQATLTAAVPPTQTPTPIPPTSTSAPPTATPTTERRSDISGFEVEEAWRRGDEPYGTLVRSTEQVHSGSFAGRLAYDFPGAGNDYVVFMRDQPLAGEPDQLSIWVYGDGVGHYLNGWIRDAQGQVWQTTFGQIGHTGWAKMTASLATGQQWPWGSISGPYNNAVDYPVDFRALVLDDAPDSYAGTGTVYLDDLVSASAGVTPPGQTPVVAVPTSTPSSAALAGTLVFPVFNTQRGRYDVYAAAADGSDRRLVMPEARQPDVRSDSLVAVNGDGGGRDNVWSMNVFGGDARAISRHPEDAHPSWSGDGGRIAFDSLLGPDKSAPRLYVHDDISATNEPRMVMFGSYEIRGRVSTWLADGRIVFNGCDYWETGANCGLYAVGDGGGMPTRLTSSADDTSADGYGTRVVFMSRRDGNWEVYSMSWDGADQQNLTRSPANDGLPSWSPDGQWIAFVSDRSGQWTMWAMRADGGAVTQLFSLDGGFGSGDYDWTLERISWGP